MLEKLKKIPLLHALFGILIFYLPLQYRYTKPLEDLAAKWFGASTYLPSSFERILSFYITDFLMIAILLLCLHRWRHWLREQIPLACFLAACLLSITVSKSSAHAWAYYHWAQLALPIIVCMALSQVEIPKLLHIFCWVLFATSLFECGVAIAEYILQHGLHLKYLGETNIDSSYSASFFMADKSRWIFDKLFHTSAPLHSILRVTGTLPHPNILGAFMAVALLCTSWLFLQKRRFWLGAALFLQVFVLFITYSRAALFGWVGASIILLFLLRNTYKIRPLALILLSATLLSGAILHKQLVKRGGVVNYNVVAQASDNSRLIYQDMAFKMVKDHPLTGVGWSQFLVYSKQHAPKNLPDNFIFQTAHNIYVLLLAETGILGLGTFLVFIAFILWRHLKNLTAESSLLVSILLFLLAVGLCDHYVLTGQHGRLLLFVSIALLNLQRVRIAVRVNI